jgi:hypothetical protein
MLLETKIVKDDGYQKQQGQMPDTQVYIGQHSELCCRHVDSMDGDQWHGHGIEFSGGRWLRSHLVRVLTFSLVRTATDKQKGIR